MNFSHGYIQLHLPQDNQFFDFCDMLVSNGAKMLTLHPRKKKKKLSRPARYFYCEELAKRYKKDGVEIILNGNVKDKASFDNAISKAPSVDGVMISRAAVQKPWIFYQLAKGGVGNCELIEENEKTVDLQQLCLDYIKDIEKYQPKEFWKTRLQRFFTYFSENFKFAHYAKTSFLNAKDNEDLVRRVEEFFLTADSRFVGFGEKAGDKLDDLHHRIKHPDQHTDHRSCKAHEALPIGCTNGFRDNL